jgi:hypothetical protein
MKNTFLERTCDVVIDSRKRLLSNLSNVSLKTEPPSSSLALAPRLVGTTGEKIGYLAVIIWAAAAVNNRCDTGAANCAGRRDY